MTKRDETSEVTRLRAATDALRDAREYVFRYIAEHPSDAREAMVVLNRMDTFIEPEGSAS